MKNIKELKNINLLYDVYCELLNNGQREIFEEYYHRDYSICEIAKQRKVSRQFISSIIKSAVDQLKQFEKKMKLVEQSNYRIAAINELINDVDNLECSLDKKKKIKLKMTKLLKREYNV
ncbi:MAG TPA: sigma factor-like helix-turn-helix DNA-binding protein [bacterium]|nr:sigma factor-like helix-turn-helix DNA-binding protein [bacterium]